MVWGVLNSSLWVLKHIWSAVWSCKADQDVVGYTNIFTGTHEPPETCEYVEVQERKDPEFSSVSQKSP